MEMTQPASTEPMYLVSESELKELEGIPNEDDSCWIQTFYGMCDEIRARGPAAQQAPGCIATPDSLKYIDNIQNMSEGIIAACMLIRGHREGLAEHDATIIAQEREKWEREREETITKYASRFSCDSCGDAKICDKEKCFHLTSMPNKMIASMLSSMAAQAREDVLKELESILDEDKEQAAFKYYTYTDNGDLVIFDSELRELISKLKVKVQ